MADRLDSWKTIASYLGREVRTVQRWAVSRRLPVHHLPGGGRPRVFARKSEIDEWLTGDGAELPVTVPSIAVLPFVNLSENPADQYFGDGLADDIIDALARLPDLRVTARTSSLAFRNVQQDVRDIGRQLGAATLLEGSVRRAGDRVRISAQLVSANDGYHLWSQSYDRQLVDMFAIQGEIAHSIALALKVRLTSEPIVERPTANQEAYELWLKGRSAGALCTHAAFAQAGAFYAGAIALDPRFAQPYGDMAAMLFQSAEFGMTSSPEEPRRAKDLILKALELNDPRGEAFATLGIVRGVVDYDWPGAELSFQRALQISPGSSYVLLRHAWYCLLPQGKVGRALMEAAEAVAQDPLSPLTHSIYALALMVARKAALAEGECRIAVDLAPGFWPPQWFLGAAMLLRGKLFQGLRQCRKVYDRFPQMPLAVGAMSQLYGQFFRKKKARELLAQLTGMVGKTYITPFAFAVAYMGLGDDRAFEYLDKAIEARDPNAIQMASLPFYDPIRNDVRFQALLAKMHLG